LVHIQKEKNLGKLGTKARKYFFVSFAGTNQYCLYDAATQTVIISLNIQFNDSSTDRNDTQSFDIEHDMDDLLSEREAELEAQEKHDKMPEAMNTDENSDSDSHISLVIELAAPRSPPTAPKSPPPHTAVPAVNLDVKRDDPHGPILVSQSEDLGV
jgi:hypothetical protein